MRVEFLAAGSSDCPLIRIFGTNADEFAAFAAMASHLSQQQAAATPKLIADRGSTEDCIVNCVCSTNDEGVTHGTEPNTFVWTLSPSGWETVCGLIAPFASGVPNERHQWLAGPEARYGLDAGKIGIVLSLSTSGRW